MRKMHLQMNRLVVLVCLLFLSISAYAEGIALIKSIVPDVGIEGDTVTVCLTVAPETLTSDAKADILWVIDKTGSMAPGMQNIIDNINYLTGELLARGIDYRNGLVTYYGNSIYPSESNVFEHFGYTSDNTTFSNWLIYAQSNLAGGWEAGLEAIVDANGNTTHVWRADAAKTIVLITDEALPCAAEGNSSLDVQTTMEDLVSQGVVVHSISNDITLNTYGTMCTPKSIADYSTGLWLDYGSSQTEWQAFLELLGTSIGDYFNVEVRDPMPPELSPIGDLCGGTVVGSEISWDISAIRSSDNYVVCCFGATITAAYAGSISNTAYVSADGVSETASDVEYIFYPSKTATCTITETHTLSPTYTRTFTPTITRTVTETSTMTPTISQTHTNTTTVTFTQTITPTTTVSMTPTITPTLIPVELLWNGPFPNPGKSHSNILYSLTREADVDITVFTVSGEKVRTEFQYGTTGINSWYWDLLNKSGNKVASGVYLIRIRAVDRAYDKTSIVWGKAAIVK